jgi:GNAT superfamily N-acetyltransferase
MSGAGAGVPDAGPDGSHLRPALAEDLLGCLDVFYAALDELHLRTGQPVLPRNAEALSRVLLHLLATDPEGSWLAEAGGRIIGFGLAHARHDHWFLAFLFVLPEWQGRQIGRAILEKCLRDAPRPGRLSVCVEAIQPVSTALYASKGMLPRTPIYVLTGELRDGGLPAGDAALVAAGLEPVPFGSLTDERVVENAVDALDREVVGYARRPEHAFLQDPGRVGFLYRRTGETAAAAYGYVQRSGRLGPVASTDPALLVPIVAHLTAAIRPVGGWQVIVPGPSAALVPLCRAGLRIDGVPALFCADWDGPRFDRYLPMNFALN